MKRFLIPFLLAAVLPGPPARAADRAIVANEQEIAALVQLIDEALKSKGVTVAQNATAQTSAVNVSALSALGESLLLIFASNSRTDGP